MLNTEIKDLDQSLTTKFPPDKNITLEDIERANNNDSKTRTEIFEFLNAYEAIAAGVNCGLYDGIHCKSRTKRCIDRYLLAIQIIH
jgi:hypothetical protein